MPNHAADGGSHASTGSILDPDSRQWNCWQTRGLAYGASWTPNCRRGAQVDWGLLESVQRRLGKNCPARFGALGEKLTLARRKPSSKKRKPNLSKSARSSLAIWAEAKQPRLLLSKKRKSSGRVVGEDEPLALRDVPNCCPRNHARRY